jgi:hypothetical protein
MCQQLTLKCIGTPDTNTSDASKLQLVGCSAESGGMALIYQVKAFAMVAEGAWPAAWCTVIHHSSVTETQKDVRKTHICTKFSEWGKRRTHLWTGGPPELNL